MNVQNSGQFGDHYLNMVYMIVKLIYSLNVNSGIYWIMSCLSISADQRLDLNKLGPNDNDTVRGQVVGKKDTHAFLSSWRWAYFFHFLCIVCQKCILKGTEGQWDPYTVFFERFWLFKQYIYLFIMFISSGKKIYRLRISYTWGTWKKEAEETVNI